MDVLDFQKGGFKTQLNSIRAKACTWNVHDHISFSKVLNIVED